MKKTLATKIKDTISLAKLNALESGHRLPVLIRVEPQLINNIGEELLNWCNSSIYINRCTPLKSNDVIGHEYDLVIFHLHNEFSPNLMAAISGTVKSGGVFACTYSESPLPSPQAFLSDPLTPPRQNKPFYDHILSEIKSDPAFFKISVTKNNIVIDAQPRERKRNNKKQNKDYFEEQNKTIELIKKVATGHRKRPLTITANRGRGKSAALGIAIGQLLSRDTEKTINIIVTAPSLSASAVIFKHVKKILPKSKSGIGYATHKKNTVSFISPDNIINNTPKLDLLIVDEAAGLSIHTLVFFLKTYSRVIFSTTLHGYEGSGQGFITRFSKSLNTVTPQWKSTTLNQPIRWNDNDPLENFIEQVFMLTPDKVGNFKAEVSINNITTRIITTKDLLNTTENKKTLKSIYFLLKSAHYKTSPNDLRQLMNSENAIIFISYYNDKLIAAAITEKEGNLPDDLIGDIYAGYRRPKGELIPQSIVMHLGIKEAAKLRYLRIMRIAVRPELQGKKIGTTLLTSITDFGKKNAFDFIGCSFGASNQLLNFWHNFDFHIFRLGYKKNSFSGYNAALLAKPISEKANELSKESNKTFAENFVAQLSDSHRDLDATLTTTILQKFIQRRGQHEVTKKVLEDVISFSKHNRSYDDNLASIKLFSLNSDFFSILSKSQSELIVLKVFQGHSWAVVSKKVGFTGKNKALSALKTSLLKIIEVQF